MSCLHLHRARRLSGPLRGAAASALLLAALTSCDDSGGSDNGTSPTENGNGTGGSGAATTGIPRYSYTVTNIFPHDPDAFTQGLLYHDGYLYEGTGQYGASALRRVDLATGTVLLERQLEQTLFGEGIAMVGDRILQLTYLSRRGFAYRRDDFELLAEFAYPTEGWGLAYDGERLLMSDGTATLYFRDPDTFAETGRVVVRYDGRELRHLNELEVVDGEVWANVWQTDLVARIDPDTGEVAGWIDLAGLLTSQEQAEADVLNGIAYDEAGKRIFVTGKYWPWLFEIALTAPLSGLSGS